MKEKENISAGAEKVEKIARAKKPLQSEAANGTSSLTEKEYRERERAERRVQEAIARREEKERAAQVRQDKKDHKKEKKQKQKKEHAPGFGGWLAAVVSLSVAVLALGAIVTVGYFDLSASKASITEGYRVSVYEFSEHVESMSTDLAKARVSSGSEMQKLLTDVLVRCELAEQSLEGLPCEGHDAEALSAFFNRSANYSRRLLRKLAAGGELTAQEEQAVEYMYETAERIREKTPALIEGAERCIADELFAAGGAFGSSFASLSESVGEVPAELADLFGGARAPEAEGSEIGEEEAASRAQEYFSAYESENLRVSGKAEGNFPCYNIEFEAKGTQYYAQISARGGMLAYFESNAPGATCNYGGEDAVRIAERFLGECGYEGLRCVWLSESGAEACAEFAAEQDGVILYADRIIVKVCEDKGAVTGLEARDYLQNHRRRTVGSAGLSAEKVERNAARRMDEVETVRLALIPQSGEEMLCWEIRGSFGGRRYIAFVDASSGETAEVYVVVGTGRGEKVI